MYFGIRVGPQFGLSLYFPLIFSGRFIRCALTRPFVEHNVVEAKIKVRYNAKDNVKDPLLSGFYILPFVNFSFDQWKGADFGSPSTD